MAALTLDKVAYSPAEAAQQLSISRAQLYELLGAGRLEARTLGARTLISRVELERFVSELPVLELS